MNMLKGIRLFLHRLRNRDMYRINPKLWEAPPVTDGSGECDHDHCKVTRYNVQQLHTYGTDERVRRLSRNRHFVEGVNSLIVQGSILPPFIVDVPTIVGGTISLGLAALDNPKVSFDTLKEAAIHRAQHEPKELMPSHEAPFFQGAASLTQEFIAFGESPATLGIALMSLAFVFLDKRDYETTHREVLPLPAGVVNAFEGEAIDGWLVD